MCLRFNIVCMNNRLNSMALRILLGGDSPLRKATQQEVKAIDDN